MLKNRQKLLDESFVPFVACCFIVGTNQSSQTAFLASVKEGLYPRWDGILRERECVGLVQDLLDEESKINTELGGMARKYSK